jgi:UDP-glucuronate decarboxylase
MKQPLRVLVTGGAGFLGSNLCRRLVREGHDVVAVDNLLTGSLDNVRDLLDHDRFRFVEHDVVEPYDIECDRIYNLACAASPVHYRRNPIHTTLTSIEGVRHALANGERHGARVLQASTSEIYGDPDVHPQPESYAGNVSTTGPRACYDEGKRCAESLMMEYWRAGRADVRIVRIFNTYGPYMAVDDGRVVSNFIIQALRDEPLTVYGDGRQTRSLCFVDDLLDGMQKLMEHDHVPGPVNLGNPREMTVLEIAERVAGKIGRGQVVHQPLPVGDPRRRQPDITLARRLIGFEPRVPFEEGLMPTIRWFEKRLAELGTHKALLRVAEPDGPTRQASGER